MSNPWIPLVHGDPTSNCWEIAVVRENNEHGRKSMGWFNHNKLLVSHNGGPCHWPLGPGLGHLMVQVAELYAEYLNRLENRLISNGGPNGLPQLDTGLMLEGTLKDN